MALERLQDSDWIFGNKDSMRVCLQRFAEAAAAALAYPWAEELAEPVAQAPADPVVRVGHTVILGGSHVPPCIINLPDPVLLSAPISVEAPCGPDLEYDNAFLEFEWALAGTPERQLGHHIIPAEGPDWSEVHRLAMELLRKSLDLRVAVALTRAWTSDHGLPGTVVGLDLIERLLKQHWEDVHPQLDASDGDDPAIRIHALATLSWKEGLVRDLRRLKVVPGPTLAAQANDALRLVESIEETLVSRLSRSCTSGYEIPTLSWRELQEYLHECGGDEIALSSRVAPATGDDHATLDAELYEAICAWIDRTGVDASSECRRAQRLTTRDFLDIVETVAPAHLDHVREFFQPKAS